MLIADQLAPLVVPIDSLRSLDGNPRRGDVKAVARSLKRFGQRKPIVVDADGTVLAGNHTLAAAIQLGWTEIAVVRMEGDDEATGRAYALADNRTSALGTFDKAAMAAMVAEVHAVDPKLLLAASFDGAEVRRLLARHRGGNTDPDAVPEPPAAAITQAGDLWHLGDHRLLCGDSTNPEHAARLMNGERAALFSTDPPYGVAYDGKGHPHAWTNKEWHGTYHEFGDKAVDSEPLYDAFVRCAVAEAILPNAAWYCWHATLRRLMVEAVWSGHGAFVHQEIVWVKDRPVLGRSHYMWQHEPCLFGWVRGHKPPRHAEDFPSTVWSFPTLLPGTSSEHPTQKPVDLFSIPMLQHTLPGEVCYEPFSGSGSQIIAAEGEGRRCFAMELEPLFVDVAVARWCAFTGEDARKEDGTSWLDGAR